jgi:hypothetical protein
MDLLKISSQDVKVVSVLRLAGWEEVKWRELILTSLVPLAGCEEVNGSELVVPISINVMFCYLNIAFGMARRARRSFEISIGKLQCRIG